MIASEALAAMTGQKPPRALYTPAVVAIDELDEALYAPPPREPAPPRFTILDALRRQIWVAVLPVIILLGIAVAIGLIRSPEYTSEARLNVGGLSLTQQSLEGYTAAVQQLAIAYSRAIDATDVVRPVARQADLSEAQVTTRVSAEPVQGSAVIRILATGGRADEAELLADGAADSLLAYAADLNSGRTAADRLLLRYRSESVAFRRALAELQRTPKGASNREAIQTRVDVTRLQKDAAGFLYQQSQAGQATTGLVQKLAPAAPADSDRDRVLLDFIAAGAMAGILIGVGLAVARVNAAARRRLDEF